MNQYAEGYIKQYHKMEEALSKHGLYSTEHKKELERLYDLFYGLRSGDQMDICSHGCKKTRIWQRVDKGWAAVCDCDESYWIKTEYM